MKIRGNANMIWKYIKNNTSDDIVLRAIHKWISIYRYIEILLSVFNIKKERMFTLYIRKHKSGNKVTTHFHIETKVWFNIRFFNIKDIQYIQKKKESIKNAAEKNRYKNNRIRRERKVDVTGENSIKTVSILCDANGILKVRTIQCHCNISEGQLRFAK